MKAIQGREKRWVRRGRLLSLFGCLPLRICMSLLRCPEKRRRGTEGGGRAKKVDREKVCKAGTSGTVSHGLTLVSCPFFDARNDQRERERRGVSNSRDRGTPRRKRNCLLHCQLMAIPASSPLNIKHKHNVHTISHFYITGPHRPI